MCALVLYVLQYIHGGLTLLNVYFIHLIHCIYLKQDLCNVEAFLSKADILHLF